jgi:hypothetical protein
MYDIRQFKPSLFILLMMGMSGYALASGSPGVWLLAMLAVVLNAWLVKTGRFRPMPRLLANGLTLLSLLYILVKLKAGIGSPILVIGEFLVILQIVKLYEQRSNRDYAQLLVLSLLLMVASAINTASLWFGLTFIAFLFLSLYCCLLFHLKVETDHAKAVMHIAPDKVNPLTLRQDQRYLSSSMRRLTAAVSAVSVAMAVFVFLFFPRGPGQGLFGSQFQLRPQQTLTGFSGEVRLDSVSRIQQNPEVVAHVKMWEDGRPVTGGSVYLRGKTFDAWDDKPGSYRWSKSYFEEEGAGPVRAGETTQFAAPLAGVKLTRQEVVLQPTGDGTLFAMRGVLSFSPGRDMKVTLSGVDGSLYSPEPITQQLKYEVVSSDQLPPARMSGQRLINDIANFRFRGTAEPSGLPPIDDTQALVQMREYALRPEVSGAGADGRPLGSQRWAITRQRGLGTPPSPTEFDRPIAQAIEKHLSQNPAYRYTLDLTDSRRPADVDPLVWFVTDEQDGRRGHCEYYAGAMVRLCHALGIQARLVVGFRCDNYNAIAGHFIVQQLHAHAWVEVLTPDGWETFDPTTGNGAPATRNSDGFWSTMRHMMDFLESRWANWVVAYDQESRTSLIQNVDTGLTNTAAASNQWMNQVKDWFNAMNFYIVSSSLLSAAIWLMSLGVAGAVAWFLIEKWRLRRRAARIGLGALPEADQIRLARQLGFYDELLRLLERRGIARPAHMTPLEFSNSITFLPAEVYDAVQRMTRIFYRVRYGSAELSPQRRRWVATALEHVQRTLEPRR